MLHIRKKDKVMVLAGRDASEKGFVTGEVIRVFPEGPETRRGKYGIRPARALVAKVNLVKRHKRPTPQEPGGIQEKEAAIPFSRLKLICPKCNQPTRPQFKMTAENKKSRFCRECGEMIL